MMTALSGAKGDCVLHFLEGYQQLLARLRRGLSEVSALESLTLAYDLLSTCLSIITRLLINGGTCLCFTAYPRKEVKMHLKATKADSV